MDDSSALCPCQSGQEYAECCGRFHRGDAAAGTAEELMRSRYSAFAVGAEDYLLQTWYSETRPTAVELDPKQKWTGLEILGTRKGGPQDKMGTVEFTARFRQDGADHEHHEVSTFVRDDGGSWVYREALSLE
ncbi:YchJ family protein [Arthrobacter crystallopoietes]|uniref:YchJ family protein n=1 Tax=Crystallibacter crystallopoietes TaxID=37928 RepID=UPI00196B034F|nr:YchJ family metal-binding protein [Arthrobacter crystallopoietes]